MRLQVPPSIQRHYWWSSKAPENPVETASVSAPLPPPGTGSSSSFPAASAETANEVSSTSTIETLFPTDSSSLGSTPTESLAGVADTISGPIIHHLGDFAAHGITSWINPSGLYVWATELVHVATGTPWWLTVILTSIALRGVLMPLTIRGMQETEKLRPIQPRINSLQNAMQVAAKKGDKIGVARIQLELKNVITSVGANPLLAPASGVLNMVISFAAFFGVRRIATMPDSPFIHGGVLWFENLGAPDPILAVVSVPFMMWTARVSSRL
jgi:membrane protein insertase Oxa1/YidC/SpoIIIJ